MEAICGYRGWDRHLMMPSCRGLAPRVPASMSQLCLPTLQTQGATVLSTSWVSIQVRPHCMSHGPMKLQKESVEGLPPPPSIASRVGGGWWLGWFCKTPWDVVFFCVVIADHTVTPPSQPCNPAITSHENPVSSLSVSMR